MYQVTSTVEQRIEEHLDQHFDDLRDLAPLHVDGYQFIIGTNDGQQWIMSGRNAKASDLAGKVHGYRHCATVHIFEDSELYDVMCSILEQLNESLICDQFIASAGLSA